MHIEINTRHFNGPIQSVQAFDRKDGAFHEKSSGQRNG